MAHYAFINDENIVIEMITGRDEDDLIDGVENWETYYSQLRGLTCKRTSYNSRGGKRIDPSNGEIISDDHYRYNYAGVGFTYDETRDAFIPPKLNPNWILDEASCLWIEANNG